MTDESQPDGVEDPKPDQDEQALAGTGNEEQDDLDTAREMETIVPSSADELDSATLRKTLCTFVVVNVKLFNGMAGFFEMT